jgi:hypothetical protein
MVINQEQVNNLSSRQDLKFEEALYLLRCGLKVFRAGWKNVQYIDMQRPDENSKMKRAYLYCVPVDNQAVPFLISNGDLFAEDWQVYK